MQALSDGKWLKGIDSLPARVQQWFYDNRQSGLTEEPKASKKTKNK